MEEQTFPADYAVYHACREHIERECQESKRFRLVGQEGCWGMRWNYGPLWFEKYWGDQEPVLEKGGPIRLVIWQTVRRNDKPKGWTRTRLTNHFKQTGFATLDPNVPYEKSWSQHARRHRAKWLKVRGEWEIFHPTVEEFLSAYKKTKFDPVLKALYGNLLKEKGHRLVLYAARRKRSGAQIEAGFAAQDIPEIRQSKHYASFIHETAKNDPIGVGLMDEWHQDALRKGYRFLDFGLFWAPGDPRDWKGFSRFKGQFGITYIHYPYPLVRLEGKISDLFR